MVKRIILIGSTGNGKSTLANVLLNKNGNFEEIFKESAGSVSETRNIQIEKVEIDLNNDGTEKLEMVIVDTVGIGDTQLTTQGVLYRLAEASTHIGEGLNQIFFVSGGRFTEKEEEVYRLLSSVIFDSNAVDFTTIIRTNFPNFDDLASCQKDLEAMRKENSKLSDIVSYVKVIYVDNPPLLGRPKAIELAKEIREESRQILLTYLGTCQSVYKPNNLNNLSQRISDYMSEKEKLQKEIIEKERLMKEQEQRMNRKINEVREKGNKQVHELEKKKEEQIREIRKNSEIQLSHLRDQNNSTNYTISKLRNQLSENEGVSSALSSFYSLSAVSSTNFSSKTLSSRVYYLKSEFERVLREKEDIRRRKNYWENEEEKERQRARRAEERVEELERKGRRLLRENRHLEAKVEQGECKIM